jgi:hypothetical protein
LQDGSTSDQLDRGFGIIDPWEIYRHTIGAFALYLRLRDAVLVDSVSQNLDKTVYTVVYRAAL